MNVAMAASAFVERVIPRLSPSFDEGGRWVIGRSTDQVRGMRPMRLGGGRPEPATPGSPIAYDQPGG
jgi:hypothetical protein